MSRRPAPLGLTKDTSEGQAYSQGSTPLGLSSDITSVRRGDYPGLIRFINKYPRTADTQEINRLMTQASVHEAAGQSSLAATCVHHAIALKKWRNLGPQEAEKYFESLAEGGKTTSEFMSDVTKYWRRCNRIGIVPQWQRGLLSLRHGHFAKTTNDWTI